MSLIDDIDLTFYNACRNGDIKLVEFAIHNNLFYGNLGLYNACLGGHIEIINLLISKGVVNNWNIGLEAACFGGYKDIADLMIRKGANNWNNALKGAYKSRHNELILLMIQYGAHIDNKIMLDDHHLEYLINTNISIGKYSDRLTEINLNMTGRHVLLNYKLITDLYRLVIEY